MLGSILLCHFCATQQLEMGCSGSSTVSRGPQPSEFHCSSLEETPGLKKLNIGENMKDDMLWFKGLAVDFCDPYFCL